MKLLCSVALGLLAGGFLLRAQDATQPKKPDAFFSGAVTECTAEKVSVARRISGKQEKRTFRVTAATIVEGKLQPKARVTVQYSTDDTGDTATRVVVHTAPAKK